jgi:hypothetical protein
MALGIALLTDWETKLLEIAYMAVQKERLAKQAQVSEFDIGQLFFGGTNKVIRMLFYRSDVIVVDSMVRGIGTHLLIMVVLASLAM